MMAIATFTVGPLEIHFSTRTFLFPRLPVSLIDICLQLLRIRSFLSISSLLTFDHQLAYLLLYMGTGRPSAN